MSRQVAHAQWFMHVNGVHAPATMRGWLVDRTSLTVKLIAASQHFRVQRLRQHSSLCLADEFAALELLRRRRVQQREVLLRCDGRPVVFAHTIVPLTATAQDWPFFGGLGERSLGTTLFGDPLVARGALQFARLGSRHPLMRRASAALGGMSASESCYARRCLFQRKKGLLLVTEVFLPDIAGVQAPQLTVCMAKQKEKPL